MKLKTSRNITPMPMRNRLLQLLALLLSLLVTGPTWAQAAVPGWNSIGPAGGGLTTLLADPSAPSASLYAGTEMNGVFHSTDAGATWHTANSGLPTGRHVYAMAALGNSVYAATDAGVYVASAGGSAAWSLLASPRALNPAPACDITLLASAKSTLYLAAPCESVVYATSVAGTAPVWVSAAVPVDQFGVAQNVSALGLLNGNIALGSVSAVYFLDANQNWINSEALTDNEGLPLPSGLLGEHLASFASSSSKWAFACSVAGLVFQADLSAGVPLSWMPLQFASDKPASCNNLAVARVGAATQSVLAMATSTGAFVSTVFDDTSPTAPSLLPGPVFPMTAYIHAALQMNPPGQTDLLWATEFGLYGSSASVLSSGNFTSSLTTLNGPARLASPSQRLDNVSVQDVAALGTSLYAVVQSGGAIVSYRDVMVSTDGGATWTPTGLNERLSENGVVRSVVSDPNAGRNVVYAGTSEGVFYRQGGNSWTLLPGGSSGDVRADVRAMAVGAQALYTGRKAGANQNGGVVTVQALIDGPQFTSFETALQTGFDVRALAVAGGLVYAAGGVKELATEIYTNAVYVASDYVAATPLVLPSWKTFGTGMISGNSVILARLAVAGGKVFVAGDGFLLQCESEVGGWGRILGLPRNLAGEDENVSALVADSSSLYVGTVQGLFSIRLAETTTKSLVIMNGSGATALPSLVVNGLRFLSGGLYVATSAGLATPAAVAPIADVGGGGGCSMAIAGEPDPLLWILLGIAALQVAYARRRRAQNAECTGKVVHTTPKDRY
jgi:hypothetical protein